MSLAIRRVSLDDDREEMIELLSRNFGPVQRERFAWCHAENPAGPCWSWFAYDPKTNMRNTPVALVTVFPRYMRVAGKRVRGGQVGEFAVDPTHRSLGPAVQLQRTTFMPVDSGDLAFCYDCPPHDRGMSTFVRLGMRPNCELYRYALPLKSEPYLEKKLGKAKWIKPLVAAANLALRIRRTHRPVKGLEVEVFECRFGDEFDALDETAANCEQIRSSRAADVLNWRYSDNSKAPSLSADGAPSKYQTLVARKHGELLAFAVLLLQRGGLASLVDIFGRDLPEVAPILLEAIVDICRKQNVTSVMGFCSEDSPLSPLLLSAGFRRRERSARVVAYTKPNGSRTFDAGLRWSFNQVEVML
jgi:hypothetical protein